MLTFLRTTIALFAIIHCVPSWADSSQRGYALVTPTATLEQIDLLAVVVTFKFPAQVSSVGDAVTLLLERSGYRLAYGANTDPELATLLALPLPHVHRNLTQIRLRDALQALAGGAWVLVEDPVNRLISFDLDERYRSPAAVVGGGV